MKNRKRVTVLLLLAMMLASYGCGAEGVEETKVDTETVTQETETETKDPYADNLPDLDYGGRTVNWFVGDYGNAYWDDLYAEEANGNLVNDTILDTRMAVEERLNVSFNYSKVSVDHAKRLEIGKTVENSIIASDGAYDIVAGWPIVELVLNDTNALLNMADSPYIDFSKPYWNQSLLDIFPGGKVYLASGDGFITNSKYMFCMFFNKDQLNDFGVTEDMYELVHSGKWTLDKLREYTELGYMDANGNGEADFGDTFGLTFGDYNKWINIQYSACIEPVGKGTEGYELLFGTEHANDVFNGWYSLVYNTVGVLKPKYNNTNNDLAIEAMNTCYADKTFMAGDAMFTQSLVGDAGMMLADVDFEYGLMPYPKYDENQSDYCTSSQWLAYFSMPNYVDAELSGAVMEAWNSTCHKTVQPAYFETTLKSRYSSDNEMSKMYDMLRKCYIFSICDVFCEPLQYISSDFKNLMIDKKEGMWMSNFEKKKTKWETALAELWDALS